MVFGIRQKINIQQDEVTSLVQVWAVTGALFFIEKWYEPTSCCLFRGAPYAVVSYVIQRYTSLANYVHRMPSIYKNPSSSRPSSTKPITHYPLPSSSQHLATLWPGLPVSAHSSYSPVSSPPPPSSATGSPPRQPSRSWSSHASC